jgi:NAD(P)-dependent dehydrogenase (short-subunit alcohol dehydrogenase family)
MARALVTNGAKRVYLLGRRREVLDAAAQENNAFIPIQCDVTSKSSLQSAVDKIAADAGYINLLLANSGVVGPTVGWRPDLTVSEIRSQLFDQAKMDDMTETMNVNVTGAFYTLVAFLELLEAGNQMALKGKGFGAPIEAGSDVLSVQSQVIITSSISAFSRAAMSPPAYSASKAAILHLTKHASSNLAHHGIRVNALAPGCKWFLSPL